MPRNYCSLIEGPSESWRKKGPKLFGQEKLVGPARCACATQLCVHALYSVAQMGKRTYTDAKRCNGQQDDVESHAGIGDRPAALDSVAR